MTENQTKQMLKMMTQCVSGIQRLEEKFEAMEKTVSEVKSDLNDVKSDVSELKEGQNRIEKELQTNNKALNKLAGDNIRINARLEILEERLELTT